MSGKAFLSCHECPVGHDSPDDIAIDAGFASTFPRQAKLPRERCSRARWHFLQMDFPRCRAFTLLDDMMKNMNNILQAKGISLDFIYFPHAATSQEDDEASARVMTECKAPRATAIFRTRQRDRSMTSRF